MKITGSHTVAAPRQQVWEALQDPAVLARTLPGCEALEVTGDGTYAATVNAGVGSIKGTYSGHVELADQRAPEAYRLTAAGSGSPGTIRADIDVRLEEHDGSTVVHYDAVAVVGGMIGGVGQRMLTGVAKRTAGEFFTAVERDLVHGPPVAAPDVAGEAAAAAPAGSQVGPQIGQVYRREPVPPPTAGRRTAALLGAVALGAAIALAGVALGRRIARDRS